MIRLKIDKNRSKEPILKLSYKKLTDREQIFLKRVIMEGREIKGNFKYEIPLRYLVPIMNNLDKNEIKVDRYSNNCFYEFSDRYDEKYYYTFEITAKYMKKWREEDCPDIFKIEINENTNEVSKEVIFKKINRI